MSSIVIVFLLNFYYFFICLSEANYGRLFFPLVLSPLIACLSRVVLDFRWLVCYAVVSNVIPLCIILYQRTILLVKAIRHRSLPTLFPRPHAHFPDL